MTIRRAARRYKLTLPIHLTELPEKTRIIHGATRNISTHGVYFTTDLPVAAGTSLEFSFTLPPDVNEENPANVAGRARVVRVEELGSSSEKLGIAAAIEIFQIKRDG